MDALIEALRGGKVTEVRRAIRADPPAARRPQAMVEAGRLGFRAALKLFAHGGGDVNAVWRGYRAVHSLIQERPPDASPPERIAGLDWLLANGVDPELTGAWPPARAIVVAGMTGEPAVVDRLRKVSRMDGFAAAALGDVKGVRKALAARREFAVERDAGFHTALQCAAGSRMAAGWLKQERR